VCLLLFVGIDECKNFFCDYLVINKKLDGNLLLNLVSTWVPVSRNHIYLYFYDPLQVINFNYLNMQICHITSPFSIEKYF
jgi:hypothetical protein